MDEKTDFNFVSLRHIIVIYQTHFLWLHVQNQTFFWMILEFSGILHHLEHVISIKFVFDEISFIIRETNFISLGRSLFERRCKSNYLVDFQIKSLSCTTMTEANTKMLFVQYATQKKSSNALAWIWTGKFFFHVNFPEKFYCHILEKKKKFREVSSFNLLPMFFFHVNGPSFLGCWLSVQWFTATVCKQKAFFFIRVILYQKSESSINSSSNLLDE